MAKLQPYIRRILLSGCAVGVLTICYLYALNNSGADDGSVSTINFGATMRVFPPVLSFLGPLLGWGALEVKGQFNAPPGVDTWCGKAYRATNASFDPGGRMDPPPRSSRPLINVQAYPRMNIYLEDEKSASLIVDTSMSYTMGKAYCSQSSNGFISSDNAKFHFTVLRADTGATLLSNVEIALNSTSNEVTIPLSSIPARMEPYDIVVKTTAPHCDQVIETKTQIYKLPKRTDGGSVTKLDNLYGGLLVQETLLNQSTWKPIFPYSFYTDWGNYLISVNNLTQFASMGYNIIHPTPGGGDIPFDPDKFAIFLDTIDSLGLWLMYDMRWTFKNLSLVESQVNALKARKSMLLWYTGDEPDGQADPLNSTVLSYNLIKKLDPYHPTSLVLNCDNFHYDSYAAGADIILTDPYPIAQNATFSTLWHTPCNSTYGDCGCDGCKGEFQDVSTRMDTLQKYQSWLGTGPKSFWGVPQAFGGSEYWARPPTAKEEVVMAMLFINHGAKGVVAWNFPTTQELADVTSALAKVLIGDDITPLLLGAKPRVLHAKGQAKGDIDVVGWKVGKKMLVSIVYLGLGDYLGDASVTLPVKAKGMRQVWPTKGSTGWLVQNSALEKSGISTMEVTLLLLDLE